MLTYTHKYNVFYFLFLFSTQIFFYCILNLSFFSDMGHFVMIEWTLDYKGTGF